ncbi:MAG: c-type cytochrome [Geminicoccaceae bacterium]
MGSTKFGICYGVLIAISTSTAFAEGDVALGEEIARESCIRCHNVDAGGPFKEHPSSFAAIAAYRSEEQIYGRIMFPPLHSAMPQLGYMLTPDNVEHLVAYIQSLETQ